MDDGGLVSDDIIMGMMTSITGSDLFIRAGNCLIIWGASSFHFAMNSASEAPVTVGIWHVSSSGLHPTGKPALERHSYAPSAIQPLVLNRRS